MSIKRYRAKRDFEKTPEPKGWDVAGAQKASKERIFVVQKHQASHLHYDFRLELDGVLKSWAVPKGPPESPGIKRLAIHVEDHPIEYAEFEGEIPAGFYGAGKVGIWDRGSYVLLWRKVDMLKFELKGKRLKGNYMLVHSRENQWLLFKLKEATD